MTTAAHHGACWQPAGEALPGRETAAQPTLDDRLRWSHREWASTPSELVGHLVCLGLVTGVFRSIDAHGPWLWWLALCGLALALRGWLVHRMAVATPRPSAQAWLVWERRNRDLALMQGLMTGVACGVYQPLASGLHQSTLMVVVFVCVVGAIPCLAARWSGFLAYAVAVAGPLGLAVVRDTSDADHLHLVGALVLLSGLVLWMLKSQRAVLDHWVRQKARVDQLRHQLAEQAAQAEIRRLEAELGRRAQTQHMASVGHDLRQPLLALNLYVQQLKARHPSPDDRELLDSLSRGLQSLDLLINDLLDSAHGEPGSRLPVMQPVRLAELYRRLQAQLGPFAFDRGLSLRWRGSHRTVWADPLMLERCLRNLVINAIAHTESGGVLVGARPRGSGVSLQVWDSGCGLSGEDRERLFETRRLVHGAVHVARGWRKPGDASQGTPSCGLGLGIVRRLAHLMGAPVVVRSAPGRGSVFEVVFGPARVSGSAGPQAAKAHSGCAVDQLG